MIAAISPKYVYYAVVQREGRERRLIRTLISLKDARGYLSILPPDYLKLFQIERCRLMKKAGYEQRIFIVYIDRPKPVPRQTPSPKKPEGRYHWHDLVAYEVVQATRTRPLENLVSVQGHYTNILNDVTRAARKFQEWFEHQPVKRPQTPPNRKEQRYG
jgi:hypothetical protein